MAEVSVKKDNSVIIVFAIKDATGIFEKTDTFQSFPLAHIKYPLLSRFTKGFEHDYRKEYKEDRFSEYNSVKILLAKLRRSSDPVRPTHKGPAEAASMKKYNKLIETTMKDSLRASQTNPNVDLFAFIEVRQGSESVEFETIWAEGLNVALEETISATFNSFFRTWDENWKWTVNGPSDDPAIQSMAAIKSRRKVKISIRYTDEANLVDIMKRLSIMMFPDVRKEEIYFSQSDDNTQISQ